MCEETGRLIGNRRFLWRWNKPSEQQVIGLRFKQYEKTRTVWRTLDGGIIKRVAAHLALAAICVFGAAQSALGQALLPKEFSILVHATVDHSPPVIHLRWPAYSRATGYKVFRKQLEETVWALKAELPGSATGYDDGDVVAGRGYEYQITATTDRAFVAYGYLYAGTGIPAVESRGRVLVLIDNRFAGDLSAELTRLERDLVGDGWQVSRQDVSPNESVVEVRERIRSVWESDRNGLRTVFLLGHIPVPYSGNIMPDGHLNHKGAWPADIYYGDVDGTWTDSTVDSTEAEREINWNVPGDGKFDQDTPPTAVELEVGRVDFEFMTTYSNKANSRSHKDLLKQYLNKNNRFRHGLISVQRRGLICDNFGDKGDDPVAGSAWRNFSGFFGPDQIVEVGWDEYFPTTTEGSYLWTYGSGGGTYYISHGVGTSDDFSTKEVRAIFCMFLGSYFGDWNNESNFLRASLGSGDILTASYSGFPHWYYHHMALGKTIGFSTRLTQNNDRDELYPPYNQGTREVHIALFGDPTLRMHPVTPPGRVSASTQSGSVALNWAAPADPEIGGYRVYRAPSMAGPFVRVSGSGLVTGLQFTDVPGSAGTFTYMVRAEKLEKTPSGTYFNLSQGMFATVTVSEPPPVSTVPAKPDGLQVSAISTTALQLNWQDRSEDEKGFVIERRVGATGDFSEVTRMAANSTGYRDEALTPATEYSYRVRAYNDAGVSDPTAVVSASTAAVKSVEMTQVRADSGGVRILFLGEAGQRVVVETSIDLKTWNSVITNDLSGATWEFQDSSGFSGDRRFYRARVLR